MFKSDGHLVADPAGEERLPVMIQRNWPVGERIIWLRDGNLSVVFGHLWKDPVDKAVVYQTLGEVCQ